MLIARKQPIPEAKKPERDIYSIYGEVNRYGVKLIPSKDGFEQWVIDAKTGKPTPKEGYECMEANGLYLWVKKGETLRAIDGLPYPSVWTK